MNFNSNNHFVFKRALSRHHNFSSWHAWRMWWEHLSESEKGSTSCRCSAVIEGHAAAAECGELKVTIYRLVKWDRDGCWAEARHAVQMKCEESSKWKYSFSPSQSCGKESWALWYHRKWQKQCLQFEFFLILCLFLASHSLILLLLRSRKCLKLNFRLVFLKYLSLFSFCELRLARLHQKNSPQQTIFFFRASGEITTKNSHLCSSGFYSCSQWWRRGKHKSVKKKR